MAMRTVTIAVTTDADQVGSTTLPHSRSGLIEALEFDFSGDAAATTDTTVTCVDSAGKVTAILTLTDIKTDGRYLPRTVSHTLAGVAQTAYEHKIPFYGFLKVAVAQGGVSITDCVSVKIYYST